MRTTLGAWPCADPAYPDAYAAMVFPLCESGGSEHGPRSPEEVAMLLEQAGGSPVAVPSPKGPGWWDVFWQDPVGAVKQATVEVAGGAAEAVKQAAQTGGEAAGAGIGGALRALGEQLGALGTTLLIGLGLVAGLMVLSAVRR